MSTNSNTKHIYKNRELKMEVEREYFTIKTLEQFLGFILN